MSPICGRPTHVTAPNGISRLAVLSLSVLLCWAGLCGLLAPSGLSAQEPVREYHFEGRAEVDGAPAPQGTLVQIQVADAVIASGRVSDEQGGWTLRVNAALLEQGVCDAIFYVGGERAQRQWNRCTVNIVLEVEHLDPPDEPTGDPPTDPPDEPTGDPPTDPPDEPTGDPPTDPPDEPTGDPPSDPPDEPTGDPPTDPPDEPTGDPPSDPPDEPTGDPPSDPPDEPTGDPTTDPPHVPTYDPPDESTSDSPIRPGSPPRTGTGGLGSEQGNVVPWYLVFGSFLGVLAGSTALVLRRWR